MPQKGCQSVKRAVFHYIDSSGFGGAERALLLLIRGLDRTQWDVTLVYHDSPGIRPLVEHTRASGASLWAIPPMPLGWGGLRKLPSFVLGLRRRRPAIFHAHLTWPLGCKFGLAAAVIARVGGVVATEHLFFDVALTRSAVFQQQMLARGLDRYVAVSRDTARRLQHLLGLPSEKIRVVHNAIETEAFDRHLNRVPGAELRGQRQSVLCVARLHEQKGHHCLLEAAASVPEARFLLAGDGPERRRLEQRTESLGISDRVVFLGDRPDIPALLAACDVFVLPSLYEGLPLAVLEAMAAGKPVVATAVGGTSEVVVHGKTGLLIRPRDPSALAIALREILSDPKWARAMGAAGRERARAHFSATRMVADVTAIYDEILTPNGARAPR